LNLQSGNNVTDQILVDKVLHGDLNAFKAIIKSTEGLITQIIFKMIPIAEDRKDIAQDTYLKTFQKIGSFKFEARLSTWIAQIAYNTCINYLQKKRLVFPGNNSEHESSEEALGVNSKIDLFISEPENLVFKKDLANILKIEIDKLSPVYKTLITLYHNEELSYSEIAEITKLPEGTVKNYLFRARKTLRDNLLLTYKKEML
jgi:RNA polymerase sigma-70 factor (ECF subfamily)